MKRTTLIKLFCLAIACLLIVPMVIACGKEDEPEAPGTIYITFELRGGEIVDGDEEIEIEAGSKLKKSQFPEVEKEGYILEYWAYDRNGEDEWKSRDTFDEDTPLYAIWVKDDAENNNNDSTGGNNTTPSTGGNTDNDDDTPTVTEKVTIEFNTGDGYFTNSADYEVTINKGGRLNSFPKPVHENPAMAFEKWYKDPSFKNAASLSDKYEADTVLYARWVQQAECTDGSYNHSYLAWDDGNKATCTKPGTSERYCQYCNNKEIKEGDPALGHQFGMWQEAFMSKERICNRAGCGEKEIVTYENITVSALGSAPGNQIVGNKETFYDVPFTNLINNRWDEGFGEFIGPRGGNMSYVQFNLIEAMVLDRIYFKGEGVTSINVFVQYEGEDDFTLLGVCGGAPTKETTPFVTPDTTRKIVSVKFVEDTPPQGTSKWQEVAFVKVAKE